MVGLTVFWAGMYLPAAHVGQESRIHGYDNGEGFAMAVRSTKQCSREGFVAWDFSEPASTLYNIYT